MARSDERYTSEPEEVAVSTTRRIAVPRRAADESGLAAEEAALREFDESDLEPDDEEEQRFLRARKPVPVRKGAVTKKTANRLRWVTGILFVVFALLAAGYALSQYGLHSWRFRVESSDDIETLGTDKVTRAQLMEVMGADIGRNIFKVPLEERKKKLEEIPWVESATVMRLLPGKVRVQVVERTPIAFVRMGSRISLIDHNGVVMELPGRSQAGYSFPVITGMAESDPLSTRAAKMRIYGRLVSELDANNAGYSHDLSEVDLADPDDVKVMVEDPAGTLTVHLGSEAFLDRFKIYKRHVSEWRQQFPKLGSVDLRYQGQIIVNPDARGTASAERAKK